MEKLLSHVSTYGFLSFNLNSAFPISKEFSVINLPWNIYCSFCFTFYLLNEKRSPSTHKSIRDLFKKGFPSLSLLRLNSRFDETPPNEWNGC